MTESGRTDDLPVVDEAVRTAMKVVYDEGFQAGQKEGFAQGLEAARVELQQLAERLSEKVPTHVSFRPLEMPIEDLDLSVRPYNILKREGIHTVGDILERTDDDLNDFRNLGHYGVEEIRTKLAALGHKLQHNPNYKL